MFNQSSRQQNDYTENRPLTKYERLHRRSSVDSVDISSPNIIGDIPSDSNDDNNHGIYCQHPERNNGLQAFYRSSVKRTAIIILAFFGVVDIGFRAYELVQSQRQVSCNCGDTVTEALANNCRYDSFAAAWLPPACRNDDLIDQFERAGPNPDGSWNYYADKNKTQLLSVNQVSRLPETGSHFFTTHQWHLVHCAYYLKKMFLSTRMHTVIEKRYDSLAHLEHCEMMFLKRDPLDTIVTEAGVALHSDVMVVAKGHNHNQNHSR